MIISDKQTESFENVIKKINRFFSYKYGVMSKDVGLIIKDNTINILINGVLKESFRPSYIKNLTIHEGKGVAEIKS